MLRRLDLRVAAQLSNDTCDLVLNTGEARAGFIECMRCAIDLSLRCDARGDQSFLPIQLALLEGECVLRGGEVGLTLEIRRLERLDLQRGGRELRLRFLDVDAKRRIVESIEKIAAVHALVVVYGELDDSAGYVRT